MPVLDQAEHWLDRYFAGQNPDPKNPLAPAGSDFRKKKYGRLSQNPIWMYHYLWKDRKDPCSKNGREKVSRAGSRRCGRT